MLALIATLLLAPPATADAVVKATLDAHPALGSIEARVSALEAAVTQARVQADPMVGLQYSNMPLTRPWPGEHPMSGVQISLSQRLTGAAKIDARVALAKARVQADRRAHAEARNRLGALAAEGWHRLALTRALAGLTVGHRATVKQLRAVLQVRYATNSAAQHELVQIDLLDAELDEAKADLDAQALALQARLNAAMGREPTARIVTPDVQAAPAAEPLPTLLAAVDAHPRLATLTARDAVEAAGVERADAERRPDVTLSANYRFRAAVDGGDPGDDFIGIGASMPLPWLWNDARWGAQAAQHQATRRALTAQGEMLRRSLRAELAAAHADQGRALARADALATRLLPTARTALESALTGYRVGRASFEALYRAQRKLLDLEQALRRARSAAALARVRIDAAIGRFSQEAP